METVSLYAKKADFFVQSALNNPYVMAILKVGIVMYAAQLAPRLPQGVTDVFANTFFKIFALFFIVYLSERDFQLAIILAVVFVFGANLASGRGILESFSDYSSDYESKSNLKLIEPKSVIYPGCQGITLKDLEQAFEGDKIKLQKTVMYAYNELLHNTKDKTALERLKRLAYAVGLPYNVAWKEENAPFIASILMYHGFEFSDSCRVPQQ
jgi:hypothetical protein